MKLVFVLCVENYTPNVLVSTWSGGSVINCPFDNNFYNSQDELIRQVTINCAERGLLLLRVRDEINMSMEAYEILYCSSVAFGMRKALQSQEGKEELHQRIKALEVNLKCVEKSLL